MVVKEARRWQGGDQLDLHSKTLSQKGGGCGKYMFIEGVINLLLLLFPK